MSLGNATASTGGDSRPCRAKALAPIVWPACWNCATPVIGYDPEPGVDGDPCCSLRCALGDWLADQNGLPRAFNAPAYQPLIKQEAK